MIIIFLLKVTNKQWELKNKRLLPVIPALKVLYDGEYDMFAFNMRIDLSSKTFSRPFKNIIAAGKFAFFLPAHKGRDST